MPTTTKSRSASDLPGKVVVEAGRAMLPVLAGKLLAAVADRAVDAVDSLAGRLDDLGAEQRAPRPQQAEPEAAPARSGGGGGGGMGAALSLVVTQARALLDLLMRLLQQAAQALRGLAARARRQQAPEGHDAEREALEGGAEDSDEDTDEFDDDLEDEDDLDDDLEDEDAPEPARAS